MVIADQTEARRRSSNYFTLLELGGNDKTADAAWRELTESGADLDAPLTLAQATSALRRLDIDEKLLSSTFLRVRRSYDALDPADLVLERGTNGYPGHLADTNDAPTFIFVRGSDDCLNFPGLAIVGTREASPDGRRRAFKLAYLLAKRQLTVVSGLARGIDTAAHLGALEIGGLTIAVIGTPITRVYPKENDALQTLIARTGAVVSQFYPGAKIGRFSFPMRNATMSALALGTVVIEASQTSGALVQARKALQQGRKLFIPQSALDNRDLTWPRTMADRGGHVFRTIEDLVDVLEREHLIPKEPATPREATATAQLLRANAG